MCGIVGIFAQPGFISGEEFRGHVVKMMDSLRHRGPDDSGAWIDPLVGIALGHRRLSILDLSAAGRQPMISESGRYVIVFNGEIYNFRELQAELEAMPHAVRPRFAGNSDTEVILACVERWGVEESVRRFNGMFALALWDRQRRRLHLMRDRFGEKPLYYGWLGNVFLFGSELKALRAFPGFAGEVNRDVLALFLRYSYVPAPHCIYKGISKLLPGTILTLELNGKVSDAKITAYWSAKEAAEQGISTPLGVSEEEAASQLEALLIDAVKMRMVADVPLGAFLSGGIDSSTVVALMQSQNRLPVRTFTIGFHEPRYNEAQHAKIIARHLGTDHTELYLTAPEAMSIIPSLPTIYDEPFADASQIPTFLVSALARLSVTVSLSGDGGDEIFGGYTRYYLGERICNNIGCVPQALRRLISETLMGVSPRAWDRVFRVVSPAFSAKMLKCNAAHKLRKLAEILPAGSPEAVYLQFVSHWKDPASVVPGASEPISLVTDPSQWARVPGSAHRMMFLDTVTYLPDDILVKVDRASMAVGLESRAPLLDHRLLEYVWRLPISMKVRKGQGKRILRRVLYKYVPKALVERPKAGFSIPLDEWLRGPLRPWAEELLDERRIRREGYFDPAPIRRQWDEYRSGRDNRFYLMWGVLMFQSWLESQSSPQAAKCSMLCSSSDAVAAGIKPVITQSRR